MREIQFVVQHSEEESVLSYLNLNIRYSYI